MLFEVVTIRPALYDRQERFDLIISKLKLLLKTKTPTSHFKVIYPFNVSHARLE